MAGSQTISIEDHVMSSARGFLYGHPLAWDVPGHDRPSRHVPGVRSRVWQSAVRVVRRRADGNRGPVAVGAGDCG